jgi:hypothetical protein
MDYGMFTEEELDKMFNHAMDIVGCIKKHYADDEDYLHQIDEFVMLNTFAFNCFSVMARKLKLKTQNTPE